MGGNSLLDEGDSSVKEARWEYSVDGGGTGYSDVAVSLG